MQAITQSRGRRLLCLLRRTWTEMDYAQRRVFELQTGVSATPTRSVTDRRLDELEALYALAAARRRRPDAG